MDLPTVGIRPGWALGPRGRFRRPCWRYKQIQRLYRTREAVQACLSIGEIARVRQEALGEPAFAAPLYFGR